MGARSSIGALAPCIAILLCVALVLVSNGCIPSRIEVGTSPRTEAPRATIQTLTVIGRSTEGRPIEMYRFGRPGPVTMIIAGIHGNEPTGTYVAEQLVKFLSDSAAEADAGSVVVVPRANPDGLAAAHRTNARGVDLNRNFPARNWAATHPGLTFGGPASASEPETTALIDVISTLKPRLIISIHSITGGMECNNYDGPARREAEEMGRCNRYPIKPTIGYPTPGSLGSWAGIDNHIRVLTLELPRDLPAESAWAKNRQALLSVLRPKPLTHCATSQRSPAPGTTTSRTAVDGVPGDNR